jgi:hypothetical protein
MASDEENCIRAITSALSQVALRLQGEALPTGTAQVSTEEAAEFVEMLDGVIASATSEERARLLLYDISSDLMPTLVRMLRTPYTSVTHGSLSRLLISTLRCLLRAAEFHSTPETQSYISRLTCSTIVDNGGVEALASMVSEAHTAEVHFATGELLFKLVLRSEAARRTLVENGLLENLVNAVDQGTSPQIRCFACACLRELAGSDAAAILRTPKATSTFVRSLGLDDAVDVRALCAELLDVVFKSEPHAWREFDEAKLLASALATRLERERAPEVLEACLKLLETLFVCDTAMAETTASFTEYFIAAFGDRLIVATMAVSLHVASLAARTLRLLLQLAPHYRFVGYSLCQHFPSITTLMRAMVQLQSSDAGGADAAGDVPKKILGVELSIVFGLLVAQDPRCRDLLRQQLLATPQWMAQLRSSILGCMNEAAMEYFLGVAVIDATGVLLNDPRAVKWEPNGARPMRASIEQVLPLQEARWNSNHGLLPPPADIRDVDASQAARLAFILLSYVVHATFTDVPVRGRTAGAVGTQADVSGASPLLGGARLSSASPSRRMGPHDVPYTRTAVLRESLTHPVKAAADRRVERSWPEALPRAASFYDERPPTSIGKRSAPKLPSPVDNPTFGKFDAALKLVRKFAHFYNNVGEPNAVIYETDGAYARRQPRNATWFAAPTPKAKSWTVEQLKEGDLFYFSLPFVALSAAALEQVRQRAVRHLRYVKNSFTITPQSAKARRWFLFDMMNHIMPGIIETLTSFAALCTIHGDENVKFPVVMFRERDVSNDGTLHSGNLLEVLDQVRFYFSSVAPRDVDSASCRPVTRRARGAPYVAVPAGRRGEDPGAEQRPLHWPRSHLHEIRRRRERRRRFGLHPGDGAPWRRHVHR